jgi:flagellar protein FlaF
MDMARRAYADSAQPVRTERGTEYAAFARVTQALKTSAARGREGFPDLARAVHENRRLWTTLAASVADSDNALPQDLRARLFYLAEFTDAHSREVLRGKATVDALVDVNLAVMRGLGDGTTPR